MIGEDGGRGGGVRATAMVDIGAYSTSHQQSPIDSVLGRVKKGWEPEMSTVPPLRQSLARAGGAEQKGLPLACVVDDS